MRLARWFLPIAAAAALAGCAAHRKSAAVVAAPPPAPVVVAALPEGASAGMLVPEPLADGSFPTPNRQLSGAAAIWHLRAGLNVAALSCPGVEGEAIRASYNDWLVRRKAVLARVAASYAAQYDRATFDDAMTRLYNFWSQTPVRASFCAAAAGIAAGVASADPATDPTRAEADLAALDAPFVDFYRAYDAWRRGAPAQPVIAAAAPLPPGPVTPAPRPTRLVLDLSSLPVDTEVSGGR